MADTGDATNPNRPRAVPAATVSQLADRVVAAPDRPAQHKTLADLVTVAVRNGQHVPAACALAQSGREGPRLAVEFIYRLPDPLPPDLVAPAVVWLATKDVPVPLKLAVAGRFLAVVPDTPAAVQAVVQAVTTGLSDIRALERMVQLQGRVERCQSLDAMVALAEQRIVVACPKCSVRMSPRELTTHLWHRHKLVFEHGQARDPSPTLAADVAAAAESGDPVELDRAFLQTALYFPEAAPRQVLQALAARGASDPTQLDRLMARAIHDRAGLCPVCLSAVPDPVPALPPEAAVGAGRVAADGFAVDVEQSPWGREVTVTVPGAADEVIADVAGGMPPRFAASASAAIVMTLGLVVMLVVRPSVVPPVMLGVGVTIIAWLTYIGVRWLRGPLPNRNERAVDLAWRMIVPGIGRSSVAVRFLTRLCRASIGVGHATERARYLSELVEQSAVLADRTSAHSSLFAATRVLEVLDEARMGHERVTGLLGVFEPFARGDATPTYIEAAAELVLASGALTSGDARRLGVLVVEAAFEGGLSPIDLATIARFCPWYRKIILGARPDHVALLYAVWKGRHTRSWSSAGEAIPVFDLARNDPGESRRLLADHPDMLLKLVLERAVEDELGAIVLTPHGLCIGDLVCTDVSTPIAVVRASGGWRLDFGPHRIVLAGKLPDRSTDALRKWLVYHQSKLLPAAEQAASRGVNPQTAGILAPLAVVCPLCESYCVHRTGQLGTPWQAVAPAG